MLEQLERHEVEEQRLEPRLVNPPAYTPENDQRQRRRMVIALILLLVALGLVLIKDRDFWFPSSDVAESEPVDDQPPVATLEPTTSPAAEAPKPVAPTRKKGHTAVHSKTPETVVPAPVVTASRAVLPPLRVDVVSNDQHQPVRPGSPSIKVEMQPGTVVPSVSDSAPAGTEVASAGTAPLTNAGERVQMSTDTRQLLSRPVRPEYPLLARQMKVQGKVALAASIGKDGGIQKLQVLGGPDILADAAREAVRQWRFKPYYQEGQPVETQANITVNFTIATD